MEESIALFTTQGRSYEWFLLLYDERASKFTNWCCTRINSLPLDRCPKPGSWFYIHFGYAFWGAHKMRKDASIRAAFPQKHIVITKMRNVYDSINLPMEQVHPGNKRVWGMALQGNIDSLTREVTVTVASGNMESNWRSEVKLNGDDESTANNGFAMSRCQVQSASRRSRNRSSLTSIEEEMKRWADKRRILADCRNVVK